MSLNGFKLGHRPQLDGLRAIAVLLVMCDHSGVALFRGGLIGVDIFFVLSGFLITTLLVQEFDRHHKIDLKSFYVRRLLRLGPALLLLLALFSIGCLFLFPKERMQYNLLDTLISLFYLSNWARAFEVHPPDYLGHTWSLSIEEQFYMLWPLTAYFLLRHVDSRRRMVMIALAIAAGSAGLRCFMDFNGVSINRMYNGLDCRVDGLMLGAAMGIAFSSGLVTERIKERFTAFSPVLLPCAVALLAGVVFFADVQDRRLYSIGFLAVALAVLVLLFEVLLRPEGLIGRVLATRWLAWVGSISYGLYLWHYPIVRALTAPKLPRLDPWVVLGVMAVLSFGVAIASYYLVEVRFLRLKGRFASGPAATHPGSEAARLTGARPSSP